MNIGFVGIIFGEKELRTRSCILKNASVERLHNLIESNLETLDKILDYLIENKIHLFRISSGIIPFASHSANNLQWQKIFKSKLTKLGKKAKDNKIRLSMHPGQYTLLSTQNQSLLEKSVLDLKYHCDLLDCMELPSSSKLILHIGGVYNDKEKSMHTFIDNYSFLPENIKKRLVIENDDKSYTVEDVLNISKEINCPVVFDYLHFILNHYDNEIDTKERLYTCRKTWKKEDGTQKIHYSQQAENKRLGSHSNTIDPYQFFQFSKILPKDIDVMFEVKDKNLSVLKYYNFLKQEKNEDF